MSAETAGGAVRLMARLGRAMRVGVARILRDFARLLRARRRPRVVVPNPTLVGYYAGKADVGAKHSTPPMPGTRGSGIEIVDATLPADLAAEIARDDHASRVVAELRDLERRGLA